MNPDIFYGYCITHYDGTALKYLTGVFRAPGEGSYRWIENKNLAYLYDTEEKARVIAGYFPGSIIEEFKR